MSSLNKLESQLCTCVYTVGVLYSHLHVRILPTHMQPEIFNVCASEGVSSVWEEPVEYRVDTPFSAAKREQQALAFNFNGLTPPPAPRRGLAYLQYMGQITPTRCQIHMRTPQSCTDLDITPVATPLKVRKWYVLMHVQCVHTVYVFGQRTRVDSTPDMYIHTYMYVCTVCSL